MKQRIGQAGRAVDAAFERTGLAALFERSMRSGVTILMYHRILPDEACADYPLPSLAVPASMFEAQVSVLAKRYEVFPCREAIGVLDAGEMPNRPVICLTFDDGYEDNASIAAPILEARDLRATFFITADLIGTQDLLWFDHACLLFQELGADRVLTLTYEGLGVQRNGAHWESPREWVHYLKTLSHDERDVVLSTCQQDAPGSCDANRFRLMSEEQVRSLAMRGHEIGSHTKKHPLLTQLDESTLRTELCDSRNRIADMTDESPIGFCYPNGDHDDHVCDAVRDAGYSYACITEPGLNRRDVDLMKLKRLDMNPQRVTAPDGELDERAFRGELSGYRERIRWMIRRCTSAFGSRT